MEKSRITSLIDTAIQDEKRGADGIDWTFFHRMTEDDRNAFDRYLVDADDPLAHQASAQENRWRSYIRRYL